MTPETHTPTTSERSMHPEAMASVPHAYRGLADDSTRAPNVYRVLEILRRGRGTEPDLAPSLADQRAPTEASLPELVAHLRADPRWTVHVVEGERERLLDWVRSGHAFVTMARGEWVVARRNRVGRLRQTRVGHEREETRALPLRRGGLWSSVEGSPVLLVEPRLGLQALSGERLGTRRPGRRLRALMSLEGPDLWAFLMYALVLGGLSLAVPVAVQVLVNTIAFGSLLQPLVVLAVLLLGVLALAGTIRVLEWYALELLQRRIFVRVAEDFARRFVTLKDEVHDETHLGEKANRFFEVVTLQKTTGQLLLGGLGLALQTVVGMFLLGFYHPILLAFDLVLVAGGVVVLLLGRGAVDSAVAESKSKYAVAAWLENTAAHPRVFGRGAGISYATTRADLLTRAYLSARRQHFRRVLRQGIGGVVMQSLAMVALLGVGGWLVMRGELTLGQLVAAELVVGAIGGGFAKMGKYLESAYDLLASVDKVGEVVDLPVDDVGELGGPSAGPLALELREFPWREADASGWNLQIPAGARVCLGPELGPDSQRLTDILAGYRRPDRGELVVGEDDGLSELRLRAWSRLVRRGEAFEGSVLENLRAANPRMGVEEGYAWMRRVGLDAEIDDVHAAVDGGAQPGTRRLSKAARVRLSLARAMAAAPGLLVVDHGLDQLEDLNWAEPAADPLLRELFAADAPWTLLVATREPEVMSACTHVLGASGLSTREAKEFSP